MSTRSRPATPIDPDSSDVPPHVFSHDVPGPLPWSDLARDPAPEPAPPPVAARAAPERLVSLDAYRGLVMVLMVSAGLRIPAVVRNLSSESGWGGTRQRVWEWLAFHTDHVAWIGCSLWDVIQPSFMFMVGAALAFSVAGRRAKGHTFWRMLGHAMFRSVLLVALSIFLISWGKITDWSFVNVLCQIGLGYTFLFLVAWLKPYWQVAIALAILALYWGAFAKYPAPDSSKSNAELGLRADWPRQQGLAAHWEKNTNLAARVDLWLLNKFPRENGKPFEYGPEGSGKYSGGYATLNFVPSLATMIFGLLAGGLVRSRMGHGGKLGVMLAVGIVGLAAGWYLGWKGYCPVVKRIWTPSWTLYSAGLSFLLLAGFYLVIEVARFKSWAMPLVVVGMNSIAIYCMSMLMKPWVTASAKRHLGAGIFDRFGTAYTPMVEAAFFLAVLWLVAWWMYRNRFFVKI